MMSKLKIETIKNPDQILNYWRKEKLVVICIILFGLSFNISMILGPIYQGKLIDSLAAGDHLLKILKIAVAFVLIIAAVQLLRYFKRFYIRRFANSTSATMRLMIYNNIMSKNVSELKEESSGNLMTRAISDVDLCVEGMRKFTTEVFDTGVLMVSYLVSMLMYDAEVTLISCLFIPLAMLLAEKLKSLIYRYTSAYRQKSSEISELTYDIIDNVMLYRANGIEVINSKKYGIELEDLQNKATKAGILENTMQPVYYVIAMLGIIPVIYFGGSNVIRGEWSVGLFVTYITMFAALAGKASKAAKLFNSVQNSKVSWKRIKPYLTEYVIKDTTSNIITPATTLTIENLTFSYPGDGNSVFEKLHLEGKTGEIIGVTGPIASGKSTFGLALLGMYPYQGSIQIDGRELTDYSEFERSLMISYMGHSPQLLSDTIYHNITLGIEQDITAVLKDVCFEEDLATMEEGTATIVGNSGIRLSGGQQARIALARTLINKSKIIILDDPFSAVDMKTEERIIENLKDHYKNSIIILISHRLASFNRTDRILLLHNNKIAEYGNHQSLQSSEYYTTICRLQGLEGGESDVKELSR